MDGLIAWVVWSVVAGVTAPIWLPIADVIIGCVVNIIDPRRW